jgi:hypothetical protein
MATGADSLVERLASGKIPLDSLEKILAYMSNEQVDILARCQVAGRITLAQARELAVAIRQAQLHRQREKEMAP